MSYLVSRTLFYLKHIDQSNIQISKLLSTGSTLALILLLSQFEQPCAQRVERARVERAREKSRRLGQLAAEDFQGLESEYKNPDTFEDRTPVVVNKNPDTFEDKAPAVVDMKPVVVDMNRDWRRMTESKLRKLEQQYPKKPSRDDEDCDEVKGHKSPPKYDEKPKPAVEGNPDTYEDMGKTEKNKDQLRKLATMRRKLQEKSA